ncbi:MAG: hypothetical protein WBA13_18980 [Microcoleaceae cyanobacterium]
MSNDRKTIHIRIVPREPSLGEAMDMTFGGEKGTEIRKGFVDSRRRHKTRKRRELPSFGSESEN